MNALEKEVLVCVHCQAEVQATDEFCPHCGMLFEEESVCAHHHGVGAVGVCVVCARPFCEKCGGWSNERFLCKQHEDKTFYDGSNHGKKSEVFFGDTR